MKKALSVFFFSIVLGNVVFANKILDSFIGSGAKAIVDDATSTLLILAPIVATCCCIYFLMRKSGADEHQAQMWNKRIVTAIICGVAVFLVAGAMSLFTSYFKA